MDDIYGCGLHCNSCTAVGGIDPAGGSHEFAERWLRPSGARESRNANGIYEFVQAGGPEGRVILMPINSGNMELAGCWANFGKEFFNFADGTPYTICDCFGGNNRCDDDSASLALAYLRSGNSSEESEKLCTCWVFQNGFMWPPEVKCIGKSTPNGPIPVQFFSTYLYNAGIIHLGERGEGGFAVGGSNTCTPNAAVSCYGRQELGGGGCAPDNFNVDGFYNNNNPRDFERLIVLQMNATFAGNRPEDRLRNLLMAFIKADITLPQPVLGMVQMESRRRLNADNNNADLPAFRRSYNLSGGDDTRTISFSHFTGRIEPFGFDIYPTTAPFQQEAQGVIPDTATIDIRISASSSADYDRSFKGVSVFINDVFVGDVFKGDFQNCSEQSDIINLPVDYWNETVMTDFTDPQDPVPRTNISIKLQPLGIASDDCPNPSWFEMTIAYSGTTTVEGPLDFQNLIALETLTGRMRKSGRTVTGEWVIVDGEMATSVHLHRVNRNHPLDGQLLPDGTYPLIVTRLRCHMGVRISTADIDAFNAAAYTLDGVPLTLKENYAPDNNFPTLEGDVDQIEWYDSSGDFVRPPSRVVWRGHLGWTTDPQTSGIGSNCQTIHGLFGDNIPAMGSHRAGNPGERNLVWLGNMSVKFDR